MTLKDRKVLTKKKHMCWGCGKVHAPNTPMRYHVEVFEGEFGTSYWCESCDEVLNLYSNEFIGGIAVGDVAQFKKEIYKDDKI